MEVVLKGGPSSLKEELLTSTLDQEEGAEMGKVWLASSLPLFHE